MPAKISSVHKTQVDLTGLMTVLGQHLYSTPMVALRELVQNAHDSLVRRRIEDKGFDGEGQIRVTGDVAKGIVRIVDTGAGLTEKEIHSFLATVGVGYTRTLREKTDSEELIGLFGLGFLSAFVLADKVTLVTTSYRNPDQAWCYQSNDGRQYWVTEKPPRETVGTEVELILREPYRHLAGAGMLEKILGRYCALIPDPIYIGDSQEPLNAIAPPWRKDPDAPVDHPVQYRKKCLAFASLFEERFEPLCTMEVKPSGLSDARGLLWIQNGASYATSDNRNLSVFVRGMLLDDDARDMLPPWAGFVGGVIESNHLTPTASREDLQKNDVYRAVVQALKEALVEGMATVARQDGAAWRRVLSRHNEALLGASLCDPRLFSLLADDLEIPTSQGDLPVEGLRHAGCLHVTLGSEGGFEEMLFRSLKVPVARGERYAVVPFLREWATQRGGRLIEVGTAQGNQEMFTPGRLEDDEAQWLTGQLCDGELLVPAHFAPAELPLVIVPDREAELKRRLEEDQADARISVTALKLARAFTAKVDGSVLSRLYLNLDCPAVVSLLEAFRAGSPGAEAAARLLWSLKVVMASDREDSKLDLNKALSRLCEAAQAVAGISDISTTNK